MPHEKQQTVVRPIPGADAGYYITPDGLVLKAVATHMRGDYKWAHVHEGGHQKSRAVHRMVAATYAPNPEHKPQVNHKNGDKLDNRAENLEWVTPRENTLHAHRLGLTGRRHQPVAMLDSEGCHVLRTFYSMKEAAAALGVGHPSHISNCVRGRAATAYGFKWRYV